MPPRGARQRASDALVAIERASGYIAGHTLETFREDAFATDAVMWNFIVLGEAANHIPVSTQRRYPDVQWIRIRGMRNVLVHQYFEIDLETVWNTFHQDIPPLVTRLQDILDNE